MRADAPKLPKMSRWRASAAWSKPSLWTNSNKGFIIRGIMFEYQEGRKTDSSSGEEDQTNRLIMAGTEAILG